MPSKRGGKRKGAGRPRSNPPTIGQNVRITSHHAKLLRMWGKGDVSAGLRWLIDAVAPMIHRPDPTQPQPPPSPSP